MKSNVDIQRKIKACLALAAPGSGATEHERRTAQAMADKLKASIKNLEDNLSLHIHIGIGGFRFNTQDVVNNGWAWHGPTNSTTTGGY